MGAPVLLSPPPSSERPRCSRDRRGKLFPIERLSKKGGTPSGIPCAVYTTRPLTCTQNARNGSSISPFLNIVVPRCGHVVLEVPPNLGAQGEGGYRRGPCITGTSCSGPCRLGPVLSNGGPPPHVREAALSCLGPHRVGGPDLIPFFFWPGVSASRPQENEIPFPSRGAPNLMQGAGDFPPLHQHKGGRNLTLLRFCRRGASNLRQGARANQEPAPF